MIPCRREEVIFKRSLKSPVVESLHGSTIHERRRQQGWQRGRRSWPRWRWPTRCQPAQQGPRSSKDFPEQLVSREEPLQRTPGWHLGAGAVGDLACHRRPLHLLHCKDLALLLLHKGLLHLLHHDLPLRLHGLAHGSKLAPSQDGARWSAKNQVSQAERIFPCRCLDSCRRNQGTRGLPSPGLDTTGASQG